ncbi:MAG TPA: MerR family transcriptional regulator, partial [Ktedonobacterales bacterium]|nr:MerR family transcriptional regulator [Ktedonobacterales bacterium]
MPSDQSDRMWYYDEIAQRFGISTRTLQNWIQAGKISPLVDPTDTRRRILRDRDVEKLAKMFGRSDESTTIFQKVARLEDAYGPFDVTAKALLTLAVEMSNGHVLRGLYVLRAAIANQWPGIPSLTTPLLNKLLTDQSIRNAHESSIHRALSKLDTRATQVGDDTPLSELAASGLISALSAARLASQPDPTSFAALLRAIVLDDQEVLQVLEDIPNPLRIPRGELIRELDIVRPPRASDGLSSGAAAYAPSATARYSKRHAVVMNGILEGLAFREPSTIVVCYGLSGSPIDRVHKILADLIEQSNFFGFTGQLGGYVQLLTLDVGQLQLRQPLDAQQQLLEALRQAEKQDAILLITRLHLLAPDLIQARPQVDNAILQVLANTGSAAVIALHEQESESSPTPDSNFRALSMTLVECPKYSLEQTLSMIKNYYAVEWKARDSVTV